MLLAPVWSALPISVLLGLRHGLDPDHLAAIDGVTRMNLSRGHASGGRVGLWFGLGHGLVVTAVAGLAVQLATTAQAAPLQELRVWGPLWSPMVLALLALANVIPSEAPGAAPSEARLRRWVAPGLGVFGTLLLGAVFALGFDTASQLSLWVLSASAAHTALWVALLGAGFTGGMMATDGLDAWWFARSLTGAPARLRTWSGYALALLLTAVALLQAAGLAGLPALGTPAADRPLLVLFVLLPLIVQGGRLAWLRRKPR